MPETLTGFSPPKPPDILLTSQDPFSFQDGFDTANAVDNHLRRISTASKALERQDMMETKTTFPSAGSISFRDDFERIDDLHTRFGIRGAQRLAHDPVIDRARYERANNDQERESVKRGVIIDMGKTLYERAHTAQSTVAYYQDNEGRIHNPDFPGESFDVILQRGLENSRRNGFVDYEREVAEFAGWKEVMTTLFSAKTPLESKEIVISGPGLKKGTAFTDNFVDIYTKAIDPTTGKVVVVMTRFASGVNYDEYGKTASCFDENYFGSEKGQLESDIFFKNHPIFIDSRIDSRSANQLFDEEFKKQKEATEEEKTKGYLDQCRLFIMHYADSICAEFFNPDKVKIAFNAVINRFDELRKGFVEAVRNFVKGIFEFGRNMVDQIDYYGRMKVEEVMVGCGLSAGFSIGGIVSKIGNLISGIVRSISSVFGKESSKKGKTCFSCGEVNYCTKTCYKCGGMLM